MWNVSDPKTIDIYINIVIIVLQTMKFILYYYNDKLLDCNPQQL